MIKSWGTAQLLLRHQQREDWQLQIVGGGYSSHHWHRLTYNRFQVLGGVVLLHLGFPVQETVQLREGESYEIPPGQVHQFQALSEALVLESCWVLQGEVNSGSDIERLSLGGVLPAQGEPASA